MFFLAKKLRFTLILYKSIEQYAFQTFPVIMNELDQSYWKFQYVHKNHMKLIEWLSMRFYISQINLSRGQIYERLEWSILGFRCQVTCLLVLTLNYPPSPTATDGWMMMHNCTCREHTCKHRRFKNVWWTGHVLDGCPEAVVECCFLYQTLWFFTCIHLL